MNRKIDKLVGEFEAQLIGRVTDSTLYGYSRALTSFFDAYPNKTSPREFTINHIEDWKATLEQRYTFYGVRRDLQYLKAFFNWYRRVHDPDYWNPVSTRDIEKEMWRRRSGHSLPDTPHSANSSATVGTSGCSSTPPHRY